MVSLIVPVFLEFFHNELTECQRQANIRNGIPVTYLIFLITKKHNIYTYVFLLCGNKRVY